MSEWKSSADIRNPKWRYRDSCDTSVKRTIARVKREMKALSQAPQKVVQMKKARSK